MHLPYNIEQEVIICVNWSPKKLSKAYTWGLYNKKKKEKTKTRKCVVYI